LPSVTAAHALHWLLTQLVKPTTPAQSPATQQERLLPVLLNVVPGRQVVVQQRWVPSHAVFVAAHVALTHLFVPVSQIVLPRPE
jgi:hypothetical protein